MAYISPANLASLEQDGSGLLRLVLRFVGDAGEPAVLRQLTVGDGMTASEVRRFIYAEIRRLNAKRTVMSGLSVGQNIPELAPASAPAPTAKEVWLEKVARYKTLSGPAYGATPAAALAALLADINTTYQAGFMDA